jgi:hypothetical protein
VGAAGFEAGAVFSYSYLWAREAEAGEESGRKNRPACLLIRLSRKQDRLYMFAITSRPPTAGRIAEELSLLECKRCGLTAPAWIILDEFNVTLASELHDFASLRPLGKLSLAFVKMALKKAFLAAKTSHALGVIRS